MKYKEMFRTDSLSNFNRLVKVGMSSALSLTLLKEIDEVTKKDQIDNTLVSHRLLVASGMSPELAETTIRVLEKAIRDPGIAEAFDLAFELRSAGMPEIQAVIVLFTILNGVKYESAIDRKTDMTNEYSQCR